MKKRLTSLLIALVLSVSYLALPTGADSILDDSATAGGVITDDLLSVMASVSATDKIPVSIWTTEINADVVEEIALQKTGLNREMIREMVTNGEDDTLTSEAVDEYISAEREIYKRLQTQAHQAFVSDYAFLQTASTAESTFVSSYAPMMIVELTKSQIQTLALDADVGAMYYAPPIITESEMDISISLIRADYVRNEKGYTGTGIKIGMYDDVVPDTTAEHLKDADITILSGSADTAHASIVASILVSQDSTYTGIVPDAALYCVTHGGNTAGFYSGIESLINAGVHIINMSAEVYYFDSANSATETAEERRYGQYTEFEKWVDHIALNHSIHFVKSAGNTGSSAPSSYQYQLTHPAMAYNVITVGNIDDCNTPTPDDDQLARETAYIENAGVPNKPDLVAPGRFIANPTSPALLSGTSFSAPHVTGTIALLLEKKPSLMVLQDTVKAILTASISHSKHQYTSSDTNFDLYGAGVVDARSSYTTTSLYNFTNSSFNAYTTSNSTKSFSFSVSESDETKRISLTWLQNTQIASTNHDASASITEGIFADLDLKIIAPDGTVIPSSTVASSNGDDNLIIIQFDPSIYGYGTYTVQVILKGSSDKKVYFSLAWW